MNGPRDRGRPGGDAADRALDDALALANAAPRGRAARPGANDPLVVALGHEPAAGAHPAQQTVPHAKDTVSWPEARRIARHAARRLEARALPLGEDILGMALAQSLTALTDLPAFDSSAMDGWAVAGPGPWRLRGQVLAGQRRPADPLLGGHAVRIATGAVLPPGATAVLRSEHGSVRNLTDGEWLHVLAPHPAPDPGQEIRRRGQECRHGDELLPAGAVVTPAVLGLAAAAGYDELTVTMRPRVEILVLGDELLDHGLPRAGRVRDALGPMLPSWLRALGADVTDLRRLRDDADTLHAALAASGADLVVTTGGTAGGPVDHVHPVLARLGARLLVDGVAVRPGHPMLLAELPSGPLLAGLPGNPLAAVSGVLTLVAPALRALAGHPVPAPYAAPLTTDVPGHPVDTRLVPVVFDDESAARPLHFTGPAMLRGLAAADGMAVIPPGGGRAGQETAVLDTGALAPAWGSGG
ncbi:molybdopterin molybdotransferase MoeA [Actinacidiphila epipremni]|uniref:Molybdopterin molybdenumtransferase n=1 Tax=Actinacidiphila epipremni TaxID=2053013 RepID=A0ABX0ZN85_9ACTN|nr:molybdopterin molybdotransferase MoeA [Actinacidiphila epipremni]NJP43066.1 molybdopterin molybdotransferase MoeA [Actinacidiphila epipremni]